MLISVYCVYLIRWKGENVSTNEVANVLTGLPFIQDANVYGVEIPGNTSVHYLTPTSPLTKLE